MLNVKVLKDVLLSLAAEGFESFRDHQHLRTSAAVIPGIVGESFRALHCHVVIAHAYIRQGHYHLQMSEMQVYESSD